MSVKGITVIVCYLIALIFTDAVSVKPCPAVCAISCPFGNVLNENNCPICQCKTGCDGNVKPVGKCKSGLQRCSGNSYCVEPKYGDGVCCPVKQCPAVCLISCPFGNVLNENNCPICQCKTGCDGNVKPLATVGCKSGFQRCPGNYKCVEPKYGDGVCCPVY